MKNRKAAAAASVLLAVGALAMGGAPASATTTQGDVAVMSCYDGAPFYTKNPRYSTVPERTWARTTSRCRDINVKGDMGEHIRICFRNTGCQTAWTFAFVGQWTTIATGVKDNAEFQFEFLRHDSSIRFQGAF